MIRIRKARERGHFDYGWLETYHSFSFGRYVDRRHMGFRSLRVINEDWIQPGRGFPTHPHRDMEIVTYILEGALEHKDSTGRGGVIRPDDVQRMSAGRGIQHSEYNHSRREVVHLLQIWLLPERNGLRPSYEEKRIASAERRGKLRLLASRDARDDAVRIHTDASLYGSILAAGESIRHTLAPGRHAWIQLAKGRLRVNDVLLDEGDGAAISDERELRITAREGAEFVLFDLA
ncbi:MAG: pirin family protein [Planctomycetota bacterium]|jgi:redox-sensitive bicupin YhaK (pirin superfamily)